LQSVELASIVPLGHASLVRNWDELSARRFYILNGMPNPVDFLLQALIALALGAGIGLERQLRNHEAGLKTNALVCLGSALFVMMAHRFHEPDRIIAQILPGIGFLGVGMILRDGVHVRGLNTAATLWCSAAVGTLAGAGDRVTPVIAAALVVLANISLRTVAGRIDAMHARRGDTSEIKGQ
jgi:putative Mg2+ transporter-C (MgtC) family protein